MRRCKNKSCPVPGGRVLGKYADPSITVCRLCRNKTNQDQAKVRKKAAAKHTAMSPCGTAGCTGKVTARSVTGLCEPCLVDRQKVACANPQCSNRIHPHPYDRGSTGLCRSCYNASHKANWPQRGKPIR